MRREDFYFDSRDKVTRIHAVKWIPDVKPVCILQIIHGMAEYVERYERLAQVLTEAGILVTGEDHLGHGLSISDKDGGQNHPLGYFCSNDPATVAVRDVHRLKKIVQEQYPGTPYVILGHSMGSFMLRNYLCRYGGGIDGAIIMGTGMMPAPVVKTAGVLAKILGAVQGEKHESMLLNVIAFGSYNKRIEKPATRMDWLSRDAVMVQNYLADPLCGFTFTINGFATLFELMNRMHHAEDLQKIPKELPVMFMAGDCDPVGNYGEAVRSVAEDFRQLGMQRVECKLYSGMRHEPLNEIGREEVEQDILSWLKTVYME